MSAHTRRIVSLLAVIAIVASVLSSSLSSARAEPASDNINIFLPVVMKVWRPSPSQTVTSVQPTPTQTLTPVQATPTQTLTPMAPTPTLTPGPSTLPITSDDLINAALARGEISAETALVYKVFATFADPRLPAQFRGDDHLIPDSHIVDRVLREYATLSPATQAILNPFLIPPVYKGSWEDPVASSLASESAVALDDPPPCVEGNWDQWDHVNGIVSDVRIWWKKSRPQDATAANVYLMATENDIWPKLTTLMGRMPLPDGAVSCSGGSPDLDIYLDETVGRSYQASHSGTSCAAHPTYIVLNPAESVLTLVHEFMHTIQKSYSVLGGWCANNPFWLNEATAQWAMDYVYPGDNEEQEVADWYFDPRGQVVPLEKNDDHHQYGAYLFFFFATHYLGDNALVRRSWENTEAFESLAAVDQAIPGGFDAVWDRFAVYNWDQPPYDDYQQWDQLTVHPALYGNDLEWIVNGPAVFNSGQLSDFSSPLSLIYHQFTFESEQARLVTFYNGLTFRLTEKPVEQIPYMPMELSDGTMQYSFEARTDIESVKVQALYKVEGQSNWVLEDWTDKPYVSFCRDAKAERLQELVIIYSNSGHLSQEYASALDLPPVLEASDIGCWRYGGSGSLEFTGQSIGWFEDRQQVSFVAFERLDVHPNIPYPYVRFGVVEGQWQRTYHIENSELGCIGDASDSAALTSGNTSGGLAVLYGATSGDSLRAYVGTNTVNRGLSVTIVCPQGSFPSPLQTLPWLGLDQLTLLNDRPYLVQVGGGLVGEGDLLPSLPGAIHRFTWHLAPQREP